MKIIIVGAGQVGTYLASRLSGEGHEVTLIETSEERARTIDEAYDVRTLQGNGSSAHTLVEADVDQCRYFLAMTSDDKTNLIACSLAKALGAKNAIARIHDQTYRDSSIVNYQHHFGIDHLVHPEALCAVEIAKVIRHPGRVAVENIARGQVEVQQIRLTKKSAYLGHSLKELKLPAGVRLGYVQRGESVDVATADTVLEEDDIVTLFGHPDSLFELRGRFDPGSKAESARVVIYGGDDTGIALVRLLKNRRFRIRLIDPDKARCRALAEKLPHVTVLHGDATSLRFLEEEQIGAADYFVACTKDDEDNVMTGLQASHLGVAHVAAVVHKPDYEQLLRNLRGKVGFELTVSPRLATANEVLRYVSTAPYLQVADLPGGVGKIVELTVSVNSEQAGRKMREIPWGAGTVVVALLHKYSAKVPGPDDTVLAGDRVVVITREANLSKLAAMLAPA